MYVCIGKTMYAYNYVYLRVCKFLFCYCLRHHH